MLAGFVLLVTSTFPVAMPVSDRIYPTLEACEQMKKRILERKPLVPLECAEVMRYKQ